MQRNAEWIQNDVKHTLYNLSAFLRSLRNSAIRFYPAKVYNPPQPRRAVTCRRKRCSNLLKRKSNQA